MIERITKIDRIEVLPDGQIQIRKLTTFMENGIEIGKGEYHRHVVAPGDDVAKEDAQVQRIATAVHTRALVDSYRAKVAANVLGQKVVVPITEMPLTK